MKRFTALLFALATVIAHAGDKKAETTTLEGTGTCAKCSLAKADSCTNALLVKGPEGEVTTYIFTNNMLHGKYFCKGETEGLVVVGTIEKKDGQLMLTPVSVEKKDS